MVKLVCTLGTSPGGIFETFMNLKKGNYEAEDSKTPVEIDEVYVIRTSDAAVEFAWKLVKAIFVCCERPQAKIVDIPVEIQDINSIADFEKFRSKLSSVISPKDYVDFTGGRKAMSVAAALVAMGVKAHVVTTIIPQEEYNRISSIVKELQSKKELVEKAGKGECNEIKDKICSLVSNNARTIILA